MLACYFDCDMFTKQAYDIDLNALIPELKEILFSQTLSSSLKIPITDYFDRIEYGANYLKKLRGYNGEPYFIVRIEEPSFDYWLAFYLSIQKPHKIQLILDYYYTKKELDFVDHLQYVVLDIIDYNIFHSIDEQLMQISTWISNKRKGSRQKTRHHNQVINLNVQILNVEQTYNQNWGEPEDLTPEDRFNTKESSLIDSPYYKLLLDALLIYCEEDCKLDLERALRGEIPEKQVVLKPNFKIISMIRPIKELIILGYFRLNQKEASQWIADNFALRSKTGLNSISFQSTEKRMSYNHKEPKNAQIMYAHWFKKTTR